MSRRAWPGRWVWRPVICSRSSAPRSSTCWAITQPASTHRTTPYGRMRRAKSGLEQAGADASATLISLAVELADAIGERKYVTREGLDPLIRDAVLRDLGRLLDERAPYSYQEAAESLGRITNSAINLYASCLVP